MGPRVLIVEDEESLTLLLRYNLEAEGYEVDSVSRGDEAEIRLQERTPDKLSSAIDVDEGDNPDFALAGSDLTDIDLDVVVLPPQADEFTCVSCFLVKHQSQFDHKTKLGPICQECAA